MSTVSASTVELLTQKLTDSNAYNRSTEEQIRVLTKISNAIDYAWNNWDDEVTRTYYDVGSEKPKHAPAFFIHSWICNEDFEADGFDVKEIESAFED